MEGMEQAFRTAAIGGFHRQDVLNYLESTAKSSAEKLESLKKENETLRAQGEELSQTAEAAQSRADALVQENQRLSSDAEEKGVALRAREEALARETTEREVLERKLSELTARLLKLERSAAAYAELKDRAGTIELEAHQRAMLIEQAAQEKAQQARTEAEQLVYKMQAGYARLRTDVDATIAHASGELHRIDRTLDGVKSEFAEHDAAFQKLLDSCRESENRQPLEPLPLREEN